jgi:hypothetical protein
MSETVCNQLSYVVIRERVKNMFALATRYDNPLRSEELESLRNGRQIVLHSLSQFRDTHFSVCEQSQKAQTAFVSKGAKNRGRNFTGFGTGDRKNMFHPAVIFPEAFCIGCVSHDFLATLSIPRIDYL